MVQPRPLSPEERREIATAMKRLRKQLELLDVSPRLRAQLDAAQAAMPRWRKPG